MNRPTHHWQDRSVGNTFPTISHGREMNRLKGWQGMTDSQRVTHPRGLSKRVARGLFRLLPLSSVVRLGEDVRLRRRAHDVSPEELATAETQMLIARLRKVRRRCRAVGLAAPQLGVPLRICVVADPPSYFQRDSPEWVRATGRRELAERVLINPVVTPVGEEKVEFMEFCLSLLGATGAVWRWKTVHVSALDETGAPVQYEDTDWAARIVQHEVDHLNGQVCADLWDRSTIMSPGA